MVVLEPKKSGAGGKGTWGRPGDELNDTTIHKDDPNYDQDEDESSIGYTSYEPAEDSRHRFASSIEDFNKFKDAIKAATMEYLNSADATEFANCVKETRLPVYHQDIPYIVIKSALDRNDEERKKISHLLLHLHKHQLLTPLQVEQGFRKLYNSIDDLLLDAPNARSILRDYVTYAYGAGLLEKRVWDELEETDRLVSDATTLKSVKEKINAWIVEYFRSEDMHDARETLVEMSIRHLHFEAVKRLISCALDRTNRQRELTSQLLAFLVGDVIKPDDVARAFSILLERVEDLYLDVPDVLTYLSCFLARAVSDEVIPPAFLIRVDLTGTDMGAQVVAQAQHLLKQHDATERLQAVWGHTLKWEEQEQEQEEDDINKEKKKTKEEEKTPQK